jgi:photosystem II stability/assembly factor-like uncharacterized protein
MARSGVFWFDGLLAVGVHNDGAPAAKTPREGSGDREYESGSSLRRFALTLTLSQRERGPEMTLSQRERGPEMTLSRRERGPKLTLSQMGMGPALTVAQRERGPATGGSRTRATCGLRVGFGLAVVLLTAAAWAQTGRPALLPVQSGRPAVDPMRSDEMRSDAALRDVCFVDPQRGWAVGDRGVIWHTEDGGQHWELQRTDLTCSLESVWFIDPKRGWAAGGYSHPYTHTSSGVLLMTEDGGRTWHAGPRNVLPAVKRIRFFDARHGWAVGNASGLFPSGIFTTDSGGRTWSPVPGAKTAGWTAADFLDPLNGALAGRSGALGVVRRGGIGAAQTPPFGLRGLARIELVPPVHGWLVGEGGLLMRTDDLGTTWQSPPGRLPDGVERQFDLTALAVRGPRVWAAGTPGTRVLFTADAGQTWTAFATGQQVPIYGMSFADDARGWAVGALGTILATEDGGRSWRRQRCGGTRAALLGVFAEPERVPLELFARLSGNEGYLGVVEIVARRDVETPPATAAHPGDRVREAVLGLGACEAQSAWQFPLRQAGLEVKAEQIVAGWDQANDGRGLQQLEAHVVRQIRLWRPDVVVTHDASPRGDDPLGHLMDQVVLGAAERAADATAYVDQLTRGGLQPWTVKKVYAALAPGISGDTDLSTAQLATRLGRTVADAASEPRCLLADRFESGPSSLGFRLMVNRLPQERGQRDFFEGIVLQPGGEARRLLGDLAGEGMDMIQRIAQQRRNTEAILDRAEQDPQAGAGLLAQSTRLTQGLDPRSAAEVLHRLGQRYYQGGQWPLAAETFELMVQRYPDHPLARPARLWLVQFYASSEAAWRVHGRQRRTTVQASTMAVDATLLEDRPERAAAIARAVEQTDPDLFHEPALRFPLCGAERARGFPKEADRYLLVQRRSPTRDAWWACAEVEQWLDDPAKGQPPKPLAFCAPASTKPRLDGRLDDPIWQQAKPVALRSAAGDDGPWPAEVMLGYDAEFLYVALRCRKAPGVEYKATAGPRPRDADLSGHDRVDVMLDLDRDYATYYRFSIDHRGWTAESCWGDRSWNPNWFVAAGEDGANWTAEAAIPLEELTGRFPKAPTVWAGNVQRTVPGVGFQSFSTPASTTVIPEGFGMIIFR